MVNGVAVACIDRDGLLALRRGGRTGDVGGERGNVDGTKMTWQAVVACAIADGLKGNGWSWRGIERVKGYTRLRHRLERNGRRSWRSIGLSGGRRYDVSLQFFCVGGLGGRRQVDDLELWRVRREEIIRVVGLTALTRVNTCAAFFKARVLRGETSGSATHRLESRLQPRRRLAHLQEPS